MHLSRSIKPVPKKRGCYYFGANYTAFNWHCRGFGGERTTERLVTIDSGQTVGLGVMADSASGISSLPHSSLSSQHFVRYDFAKTLMGPLAYAQEPLLLLHL